jgi:TolB-like protein
MRNRFVTLVFLTLAVAGLSGCLGLPRFGGPPQPPAPPPQAPAPAPTPPSPPPEAPPGPAAISVTPDVDLIRVSHAMADALANELQKNHPNFRKHKPILVTSFVAQENVDNSSELGLLLADQVSTRLTQQGYSVVEAKLRQALSIRQEQGEFVLSRDIEKLSRQYKAYAVVVGNYTRNRELIYLTTRMIQVKNKRILAAVSAKMPIGASTRELLIDTNCCTSLTVVNR